jgi:AcrR family transcriptional regulator
MAQTTFSLAQDQKPSFMTTEPAPRPKTRTRILETCKDLFNERGPLAVTTAEIAAAVGIQEGNLHYHFNRKEQILETLFGQFEQALRAVAMADAGQDDPPGRYAAYLSGWFGLMWDWRCFYRDSALIYDLAPALRPRLDALNAELQGQVLRVLEGMAEAGLLKASGKQMDELVVNAWIVSTYWIDYLRSRRGIRVLTREHIDWGASQVFSLFAPYLTKAGNAAVNIGGAAR